MSDTGEGKSREQLLAEVAVLRDQLGSLGESERRFRRFTEGAEDYIFEIDRRFAIRYLNPYAALRLGNPRSEVIGKPLTGIFPPALAAELQRDLAEVFRTGEPSPLHETFFSFPGGGTWLSTHLIPLFDGQGTVESVLGIARDINEFRSTLASLRESEEQFRLLAEESPNMIFIYDIPERKTVYANARFEQVTGYSRAEYQAPGFDFFVMLAPESVDRVRRGHESHRQGEDQEPYEFAMITREGRRIEALLSSRIISYRGRRAVLGIITDISAQHRMAEALREAVAQAQSERARAESVIGALGDSIIVQDRDWRITYQNAVDKRVFGDRMGELCYRVYEGLDRPCDGCPVQETYRDGEVHRQVRTVVVGGKTLVIELVSSPLRDAEGRIVAGLKLVRDITDAAEAGENLRQAKENLERQNLELRKLDRLKDGLIRDVSHELKTPVAKQAMQLELLRAELGTECLGRVGKTIQVMEESVRRQQGVIRNLLDLARLESGRRLFQFETVRVAEILAQVVEDYRPMLDAAGFAVAFAAEPFAVTADRELLWHVFSNLMNNALKFGRGSGPRRVEISAFREDGRGVVRIADNGIGLAPEELAQAFDRFYQASASVEGSGVGLSICRTIMEGMGGTVDLASAGRGQGAVATVTLPLAPGPVGLPGRDDSEAGRSTAGVGAGYFLAAWLRLDAFSGLSFFSSFLASDFRWVAKLQRPSVHLEAGLAKTAQKTPAGNSRMLPQPSHFSITVTQRPPL